MRGGGFLEAGPRPTAAAQVGAEVPHTLRSGFRCKGGTKREVGRLPVRASGPMTRPIGVGATGGSQPRSPAIRQGQYWQSQARLLRWTVFAKCGRPTATVDDASCGGRLAAA